MSAPRLSLCMIVRNEQEMLPDCLQSAAGLWDELIVADTGSTDGTPGILAAAGARLINFPWQDDFAAARNATLAAASGRWILYLDADERMSAALHAEIRTLLDDPGAGAATVVMRNELPGGHCREADLLRLFRRDPGIRFRHRIHEDVRDDVAAYLARTGLQLRRLAGQVRHLGYVREVAADRGKRQRDESLLRRALADDPADFYCWFKLLEQARFWDDRTAWQEVAAGAAPLLTGPLTESQLGELQRHAWSGELAALISQGLHTGPAEALIWLESCRDRVQPSAAWHLRRGLWLEAAGQAAEAESAFTACLAAGRSEGQHHHLRARLGHCRLAAARGDLKLATDLAQAAAAAAPTDQEALLAAVTFTGLARGQQQLATFAAAHCGAHPAAAGPLAEVLLGNGHPDPAWEVLAAAAGPDNTLTLGLLTCALALGRPLDLTLELAQAEADEAFRKWIRILWESRRTEWMSALADNCAAVSGAFPWLPEFLASETARLQAGPES